MKEIRYDSTRGMLHAQGPLLGLIAVIFGIFVFPRFVRCFALSHSEIRCFFQLSAIFGKFSVSCNF